MNRYQIPQNLLAGFEILAQLSLSEAKELAQILQHFSVGGNPSELQKDLKNKSFVKNAVLLANTLFSFGELLLNNKGKLKFLAEDLSNAFKQECKDKVSNKEGEQLVQNLLELFRNGENLTRTFKAFQLLSENSHIYRRSRVFTDIRTIFDEECDQALKDGLIIHRLKLEYVANNEFKEIFMSLDYNDILNLEKQLKRAKEKEAQIKKNYSNLHFIHIKD